MLTYSVQVGAILFGGREGYYEGGIARSLAPITTRDICRVIANEISRNIEIVIPKTPNPAR